MQARRVDWEMMLDRSLHMEDWDAVAAEGGGAVAPSVHDILEMVQCSAVQCRAVQ